MKMRKHEIKEFLKMKNLKPQKINDLLITSIPTNLNKNTLVEFVAVNLLKLEANCFEDFRLLRKCFVKVNSVP